VESNFRATKLASTGGFLKAGNTTFLIGVPDADVQTAVDIISSVCRAREELMTPIAPVGNATSDSYVPYPIQVQVGGATVFVLDVSQFLRV
jgi:uncharacterized protein YaaQ